MLYWRYQSPIFVSYDNIIINICYSSPPTPTTSLFIMTQVSESFSTLSTTYLGHHGHQRGHPIFMASPQDMISTESRPHPKSPFFDEADWIAAFPVLDEAFDVLQKGGVILCPTALGYTMFALAGKGGSDKLDAIKGRPDGKPTGTMGTEEIFKHVFGSYPPDLRNEFCADVCMSFVGQPSSELSDKERQTLIKSKAIGPRGEV